MATTRKARFITLEGTDGSGKSTLLLRIQTWFQNRNRPCLFTREPGGTEVGEKVRSLILDHSMDPLTELFLYEAARAEHVSRVIVPALKQRKHVFCDRFTHSSMAYQGAGRGLDLKMIRQLNDTATRGLKPDAVIWLRLSHSESLKRMDLRGEKSRFDRERAQFHQAVFKAFSSMAQKNRRQFIVLDARNSPDEVFEELLSHPLWNKLFGLK